jgi:hypothetical protein
MDYIGLTKGEAEYFTNVNGGIQKTTDIGTYGQIYTDTCCHGGGVM